MRDNASATGSSMVTMLLVFVSSACCIGPLMVVFSFVGLSMTTVLSIENIFGPYRLLILAATFLFLGIGFRSAYRAREQHCEPGEVCAIPRSLLVQRIMLWIATAFMLVLLYFAYVHPNLDLWFGIYL